MFKGDDGKFTGDMTNVEIGGKKALIGWLNDKSDKPNISGYANEPGVKAPASRKIKHHFNERNSYYNALS